MQITDQERLDDLRAAIDEIDRDLVRTIARRSDVVREVMTLKGDAEAVRSPGRVAQVVANALRLADELGAPADVVEATYRAMDRGPDDDATAPSGAAGPHRRTRPTLTTNAASNRSPVHG